MRFFLLFCFIFSTSWAQGEGEASERLLKKLNAIHSMKADFTEDIWTGKKHLSHATGHIIFKKPGLFRWVMLKPMKQQLVADGSRVWTYDESLEQVTVRPQKQMMHSSALFFLKEMDQKALNVYIIENKGNNNEFILSSKDSQADFLKISLFFDQDQLSKMLLMDTLGQRTLIDFQHIRLNPQISPHIFKFSPPKGVDVIEEGDGSASSSNID